MQPRRRLLLLVPLALLLAGFLLWRGHTGPHRDAGVGTSAQVPGDEARAVTLRGLEQAGVGAGGADADAPDPFAACPVRGRVVDAETGAPVARARYFLWPRGEALPEDPYASFVEASAGAETTCYARVQYEVDPSGRLGFDRSFALVARGRDLELHVFADGYVSQTLPLEIPGTIEVRLERGLAISGWVVDATRRPVAEAEVVAWAVERGPRHLVSQTVSAPDGTFVLTGLPMGVVTVGTSLGTVDRLRRSVPRRLTPGQDDGVEIALVDLPHIVLDVRTADGGPLVRGGVVVPATWGEDLWRPGWEEAPSERIVAPLPLPPLPLPGALRLWTWGYREVTIPLDGRTPDERREVVLEPDGTRGAARLRLLWPEDPGDEPVYVRFGWRLNPGPLIPESHAYRVVESGTAEIRVAALLPVRYEVHAVGRDVAHAVAYLDVPAGGEGTATLSLQRAGTLEVVFEDAPPVGVGFYLNYEQGLEEHEEFETLLDQEELLPGGLRWSDKFLAVPDGEERAVGRVFGLAAGSYDVGPFFAARGYESWIRFRIEPGKTTRVVFPRKR